MNIQEIEKLVEQVEYEADIEFGIDLERLNILHEKKGVVAGECIYGVKYNFNPQIAQDNDGYEQTIYHEVAHQIAYQIYGEKGKGHNKYWKSVMVRLGREPNRCHNYKNIKNARKTVWYKYRCKGCGKNLNISSIRYNKATKRGWTYSCRCKTIIDIKTLEKN